MFAALGVGFSSVSIAISILLGGLVSCISNSLYIWLYFYRKPVQRNAHIILQTAYGAELSKVISVVMLMVTVIMLFDELNFLFFFAAFMVSQSVFWMAPLLSRR